METDSSVTSGEVQSTSTTTEEATATPANTDPPTEDMEALYSEIDALNK